MCFIDFNFPQYTTEMDSVEKIEESRDIYQAISFAERHLRPFFRAFWSSNERDRTVLCGGFLRKPID